MTKLAYVKSVTYNLKGHERHDLVLGPKTFILGPNRSGKTSILNAVELALEGAASDVGTPPKPWVKKASTLIACLTGTEGEVHAEVTWSDGAVSRLRLKPGKRPDPTGPGGAPFRNLWAELSGSPERAVAALFELMANAVEIDPTSLFDDSILPLLDTSHLTSLSAIEQRRKELSKELKSAKTSYAERKAQLDSLPVSAPDVGAASLKLHEALDEVGYPDVDAIRDRLAKHYAAARDQAQAARHHEDTERRQRLAADRQAAEEKARKRKRGHALLTLLEWQEQRVHGNGRQACLLCDTGPDGKGDGLPSQERLDLLRKQATQLTES